MVLLFSLALQSLHKHITHCYQSLCDDSKTISLSNAYYITHLIKIETPLNLLIPVMMLACSSIVTCRFDLDLETKHYKKIVPSNVQTVYCQSPFFISAGLQGAEGWNLFQLTKGKLSGSLWI